MLSKNPLQLVSVFSLVAPDTLNTCPFILPCEALTCIMLSLLSPVHKHGGASIAPGVEHFQLFTVRQQAAIDTVGDLPLYN